ncbi:MAG: hypothetical protein ABI743_05890 [bacterium]
MHPLILLLSLMLGLAVTEAPADLTDNQVRTALWIGTTNGLTQAAQGYRQAVDQNPTALTQLSPYLFAWPSAPSGSLKVEFSGDRMVIHRSDRPSPALPGDWSASMMPNRYFMSCDVSAVEASLRAGITNPNREFMRQQELYEGSVLPDDVRRYRAGETVLLMMTTALNATGRIPTSIAEAEQLAGMHLVNLTRPSSSPELSVASNGKDAFRVSTLVRPDIVFEQVVLVKDFTLGHVRCVTMGGHEYAQTHGGAAFQPLGAWDLVLAKDAAIPTP